MQSGFAQIFQQIVSVRVETLNNTNLVASSSIIRKKASPPVDVRRSKTSFVKKWIFTCARRKQYLRTELFLRLLVKVAVNGNKVESMV